MRLFVFVFFISLISYSQYLPMLEEGNAWGSKTSHQEEPTTYYQFEIGEEVEINNVLYKRIYLNNQVTNCSIREEDGIVYQIESSNQEKILFDFTLEVGDTFNHPFFSCFMSGNGPTTVLSVNTQFIAGQDRKVLEMSGFSDEFWIEGIGSTAGGLFGDVNWIEGESSLICFNHKGETYFFNNNTECNIVLSNNEFSINKISVIPNPISEKSILQLPIEAAIDLLVIYNLSGKIIKEEIITTNNYTINNIDYASGLYFYQIFSNGKHIKTDKFIVK